MDKPKPVSASTSEVSVESVLSFLDKEIERILSDQARSGLTVWAVLAALAGVIWLGFSTWEAGGFKANNVLLLFFVFSFGVELILYLYSGLSKPWFAEYDTDRFYPVHRIVGNRFLILLMTARAVLLIYLASISGVWWPHLFFVYLFYGYRIFEFIVDLIYDFVKIPIRVTSGGLSMPLAIALFVALVLAAWGAYKILLLVSASPDLSVSDFRMASLFTVGSILLILLARVENDYPLLSSLTNIRQYLTFKEIDIETAMRHIDITLSGMRVSDVLQEPVRRYLHSYDQMNIEYSAALKELEALEASLPESNATPSSEQLTIMQAVLQSCQQHKKTMSEFYEQGLKEEKRIRRIIRWLHGGSPRVNRSIDEVLEYISQANKEFFEKVPELNEKRDALKKRLEAATGPRNSKELIEPSKLTAP
jgi:hypothetical protein